MADAGANSAENELKDIIAEQFGTLSVNSEEEEVSLLAGEKDKEVNLGAEEASLLASEKDEEPSVVDEVEKELLKEQEELKEENINEEKVVDNGEQKACDQEEPQVKEDVEKEEDGVHHEETVKPQPASGAKALGRAVVHGYMVGDVDDHNFWEEDDDATTLDTRSSDDEHSVAHYQRPPRIRPSYILKVPRDWSKYSAFGTMVQGTPFIPFKTPFYEQTFAHKPSLEVHTVDSLVEDLGLRGIRLAVIVDLTLPKFYESEKLASYDIEYVKIPIDNKEPQRWQVDKFLKVCDDFVERHAMRQEAWQEQVTKRAARGLPPPPQFIFAIGVHCTRGVNRTGYMIVRAMIERMRFTARAAVERFNKARGHDMDEFFLALVRAERQHNQRTAAREKRTTEMRKEDS